MEGMVAVNERVMMEPERAGGPAVSDEESEFVGGRKSPLRRCIATAAIQAKDGMIRFVVSPEGQVVPDLEGNLPGRGLWLTADKAVVARAVAKNAFAKAARRAVKVDVELPQRLEAMLTGRCLDLLGLARRAGHALAGFEKVRESLASGRIGRNGPVPALLLAASDGAEDGRSKLKALARDLPVVELFSATEIGAALGRDNAVHAAMGQGGLATRFLAESRRLAGLKGTSPPAPPSKVDPGGDEGTSMVGRAPTDQTD
ncbi:MAG TPA: RNA-binding protein [Azospirillaceae bacterium]|nr:RNA-binding protein [Azospirillaceae bacterium]